MPRSARAIVGGYCYHVLNRGNNRAERFHSRSDYADFLKLMSDAGDRIPMLVLSACLMPNHVHLVVQPAHGLDLTKWIHWLFLKYSQRYHKKYGTTGRAWENRFKAFPIQGDRHLLLVLRYVERNALRANLASRAEDWEWGSLNWRCRARPPLALGESPVALPADWRTLVNEPQTEEELEAIRSCAHRQSPFGDAGWIRRTAADLGLEHSIRPRGRPAGGGLFK
jgi:putative transposase